jgi:hypothetical protein
MNKYFCYLELKLCFYDLKKLRPIIQSIELRYPYATEVEIKRNVNTWSLLLESLEKINISMVKQDVLEVLFLASIRLLKYFRKLEFVDFFF